MHSINDSYETNAADKVRRRNLPGVRTYRQIAEILAEREGTSISTSRVEQICRIAEHKVARALRNDPIVANWMACHTSRAAFRA